ncbi:MAG: SOS response-associated peptidase [Alphaproteobacteria bacterium]|jgi:putative SOS response-associated peptidase YedK|nr:SOS response-associated peptidase [Alphaproteobacteria bacterium]
MCGRYSLTTPEEALVGLFEAGPLEGHAPRFNAAPAQTLPVVRLDSDGARQWAWLRWGLVPSWAKDPAIGNRMINARAETVAEKPSFRAAFRRRRCLVIADGFYEWQARDGAKQPYHIALADGGPMAFAGLWERWDGDATLETFTILTTEASPDIAPIHHRMPVILAPAHYSVWLGAEDAGLLAGLLVPGGGVELVARAVSRHVNNPRHDDADCLASEDQLPR